jgi:hypothetical protein
VDSNAAGVMDVSLVSVVCCQIEVSARGWSLVQRSPTECGVSECHCETSTMRKRRRTRAVEPLEKKLTIQTGLGDL